MDESVDAWGEPIYDVVIERTAEYGCLKLYNLPPEAVYVDAGHTDVRLADAKGARFGA